MAHTYALGKARTSSAGNPITVSYVVANGDTVICLMIKTVGATNRAGAAPTWGTYTFTQASSTQKAAASPEASAEMWYLVNPVPATATLTIPNTNAATIKYTVGIGRATNGGQSFFDAANGGNNTSTNPTPGSVTCTTAGDMVFAITAGGWTTWAPSAQAGTIIANTDDGADGGGEQYSIRTNPGAFTLNWTFGTSDDWGAVVAAFKEVRPNGLQNYLPGLSGGAGISVTEHIA